MTGRAWVYGDEINTDLLAPGYCLRLPIEELAPHCLEALDPDFAGGVRQGDIFVAGDNLGLGSAREHAPGALLTLGIKVVLAKSFARIFYRNAINLGLPALFFAHTHEITMGDEMDVDPVAGMVRNVTTSKQYQVNSIPPHLMAIIEDGGLMAHLKKRLAS